MKPMDKITLTLSPTRREGMTRLSLSGFISTRQSNKDLRRLWRAVDQLSEQLCVVLAAGAPLPWFDVWSLRLGRGTPRQMRIRFEPPRRLRPSRFRDGEV